MFRAAILLAVFLSVSIVLLAGIDVTVIDFGQYEKRIDAEFTAMNEHIDPHYPDGTPGFVPSSSIMLLTNWIIDLQSSGIRVSNIINGQCQAVQSREHNQTVLGVRVSFPRTRQNDRAIIRPQLPLHAYDRKGNFANLSNGIVANVGLVKDVSVWIKGRNYPYDFAVRFIDNDHKIHEFFFGNLHFDNWRKLTWVNPNYIENVKLRVLERKPLYPRDIPYYRFHSFVVYRDMAQIGGDYVFYIKDLSMSHDLFAATIIDPDIEDDAVWRIIQDRIIRRMDREHRELGEKLYDLKMQMKLLRLQRAEE
jgi:hypothetical protein